MAVTPSEDTTLLEFLHAIETLKVHRSAGRPTLKKPVLLLLVLARIERGDFADNRIFFDELESRFSRAYETITGSRGSLLDPFFRLRTSGFWHVILTGQRSTLGTPPPRSVIASRESWAELEPALHALLMTSATARERSITTTMRSWFQGVEEAAGAAIIE